MTWNKPNTIWRWLALVSPGAASVLCTAIAYFFQRSAGGLAILGFPLAFFMCLGVAIFMANGAESFGKKVGLTLLFTFLLVIVNFSIGFGGCAAFPIPFDMK
jgi:hypothetical protein